MRFWAMNFVKKSLDLSKQIDLEHKKWQKITERNQNESEFGQKKYDFENKSMQ